MIEERLRRYCKEDILQFFQIFYAGYLFQRIRIAENEIAETEVVRYDAAQIHIHLLGILVDESGTVFGCIQCIFRFGRLDDERHERIFLTDGCAQLDTCQSVLFATFHAWKADIGNHS